MNAGNVSFASATPPFAPLKVPTQDLSRAPDVVFTPSSLRVTLARIVVFGGAILLTIYGYRQMTLVFGNELRSGLEWALLILFTVTFAWIALSATQGIGALFVPSRRRLGEGVPIKGRSALLMPVYNEDPAQTCAALAVMGKGLANASYGGHYEIFIISDTRDPLVWAKEIAAFNWLRRELAGKMGVWYRRRRFNTGRKAGNVADFVERWGGRYEYMLVLDADSLLEPETIAELTRRMDAEPNLGILQTVPTLIGGKTLFARLQQFANRLYGGTIARGVAAWQGLDGNYWGHNALIRVGAFAQNCGLPELPGRKPFGGHILSHDFVEAALIRRGGWDVRMDPDLGGSYEGGPPSLVDLSVRDRRWAQGNLQHAKLLKTRGLRQPNRLHFLIGIGAYLMSAVWLLLLLVGAALTAQSLFVDPRYFESPLQLFPQWPVFDPQRMAWLFALAMGLLLLPKAIGIVRALFVAPERRGFGGPLRLLPSAVVEIILSALYAPILMLLQIGHLVSIVSGRDTGWATQAREGAMLSWRAALARHRAHVIAGAVPLGVGIWYAPEQLIWLSPVIAGLIAAPVLSRYSGSVAVGRALRRVGLLSTPEERTVPQVFSAWQSASEAAVNACPRDLTDLLCNKRRLQEHCLTIASSAPGAAEVDRIDRVTARAKIEAAGDAAEALAWMSPAEVVALVGSVDLLETLASRAARSETDDRAAAAAQRH